MANIKYKYTRDVLQEAVKQSESYTDVLRFFDIKIAGGNHAHIKRQIQKFGVDTSHFRNKYDKFLSAAKEKAIRSRKTCDEVFNLSPEYRLKGKMLSRALVESGVAYKCVKCGIGDLYNGKKLTLEVDHIDENWRNNKKENLQFMCPNCHSQK